MHGQKYGVEPGEEIKRCGSLASLARLSHSHYLIGGGGQFRGKDRWFVMLRGGGSLKKTSEIAQLDRISSPSCKVRIASSEVDFEGLQHFSCLPLIAAQTREKFKIILIVST